MTRDTPASGPRPQPGPGSAPHVPGDRMLNKAQVAEILGGDFKPETIVRRWRTWGLQAHRIGKQLRWWESDVYQWADSRRI
jgi:hypothetical protein